ncbi:TrkH family potassium uptake protein [Peijinzhouia sedimentorum]
MRVNLPVIGKTLGILLTINGAFLLLPLPFSFHFDEGDYSSFIYSSLINLFVGGLLILLTRKQSSKDLKRKDGFIIVTLGWITLTLFGSLPYVFSGTISDFSNIFFETMSGYTTTGATILTDIESLPKGILFWRNLTQWIGGMGIIVLVVAILPFLGIGGMQLFVAEAPGLTPEKLQPRIRETARRLWYIYFGLTVSLILLLVLGGMPFYDATCNALSTVSSGGFSPKNASIGHYNSAYIEYVVAFFMFLAGVNFTMIYFGLKGNFSRFWANEEFRVYLFFTIIAALIVTAFLIIQEGFGFEQGFRVALFQVVSIITTTGFATADYTLWSHFLTMIFFFLLFVGGSAGSTAGGIKIVRHLLLGKNTILEFKRQLHPSAIIPVRLNGKSVPREVIQNILAFIIIYFSALGLGTILLSFDDIEIGTAISAIATSLGNVGPGVDELGPAGNFSNLLPFSKWVLSFCMLIGRLELITVLIIFTPFFWKRS